MTATIDNLADGSAEKLQADTSGMPITASYADGTLTLTGTADVATYQAVLQSITYSDTASSPNLADRTISISVNDGTSESTVATATVVLVQGSTPSGYTIAADASTYNATTATSAGFTFADAAVGDTYSYTVSSSGGGTAW